MITGLVVNHRNEWVHFTSKELSLYKGVILEEQNVAPALREQRNNSAY